MNNKMRIVWLVLLLVPSLLVEAHTGVVGVGGFLFGVIHPFTGPDHLLMLILVGIWATQQKSRALAIAIPLTFIVVMALSATALFLFTTTPLFGVEGAILLSLLLGSGVVMSRKVLTTAIALPISALFAAVHGAAHGLEAALLFVSPLSFLSGMTLSALVLIMVGVAVGRMVQGRGVAPQRLRKIHWGE
ncbi:MAG: HupE/UreJ family protein [Gammaproteobacteria bacterium]|nr:HupE/UreJ family protein [Gammaproteobacteria bacterium]